MIQLPSEHQMEIPGTSPLEPQVKVPQQESGSALVGSVSVENTESTGVATRTDEESVVASCDPRDGEISDQVDATDSEAVDAEVPTTVPAVDTWSAAIENHIDAGFERVLRAFEDKLAYDESKQEQIDRLHDELLRHREDMVARAARPLVHGMIRLHDDIGRLLTALRVKPAEQLTPDRFFTLLEGLQEDLEIVLGQNGIVAYREPGGPFDPRRQKALKRVRTCEETLAGTIAESLRPGFEQGADIVEKERVATYEYVPPSADTPGETSDEASDGAITSSESQQKES